MKDWIWTKVEALLSMLVSQRTIAAALTWVLISFLHIDPTKAAELAAAVAGVLIASFAVRKPGAEMASITLRPSPSLAPAVTFRDTASGTMQNKDQEDPK